MTHPDWLAKAVMAGLQRLLALRLRGSPATDMLAGTAKAWLAAIVSRPIAWDEQRDLPRIQRAFIDLSATVDQWPSPKQLMDAMPKSEPIDSRRLPPPRSSSMPPHVREWINNFVKAHRA